MLRRALTLAATAAGLAGCYTNYPDPTIGDRQLVVLTYDTASQKVTLTPETVSTIHYLRTMQGDAAKIYAKGSVVADANALIAANPASAADLAKLVVTNGGKPVDFSYVTVSGALYPADNDSLNVATSYYNAELAFLFFQQYKVALPDPMPVYYRASYTATAGTVVSVTDLGVSDPPLGVLVVPPFDDASVLPPSMQAGVVAYQYAANVFERQAFGTDLPLPIPLIRYGHPNTKKGETAETWQPSMNLARGLQAGFSDFFAAVIADDPAYVRTPSGAIDDSRRLDPMTPRCFTVTATPFAVSRELYDPHTFGTVLASVLWDTEASRTGTARVAFETAVVSAMGSLGTPLLKQDVKVEDALNVIATAVQRNDSNANNLLTHFCSKLLGSFNLAPSDIAACSNSSAERMSCAQ
jgi:hypothetical protein